jgi:hypothetical protein
LALMSLFLAGSQSRRRRPRTIVAVLSLLTVVGLVVLTDYPAVLGGHSRFWAEHALLSGVLVTGLLVGAGLLGFEGRLIREQNARAYRMHQVVSRATVADGWYLRLLPYAVTRPTGRFEYPANVWGDQPAMWPPEDRWEPRADDGAWVDRLVALYQVPEWREFLAASAQDGYERARRNLKEWAPLLGLAPSDSDYLGHLVEVDEAAHEIHRIASFARRQKELGGAHDERATMHRLATALESLEQVRSRQMDTALQDGERFGRDRRTFYPRSVPTKVVVWAKASYPQAVAWGRSSYRKVTPFLRRLHSRVRQRVQR